MDALIAVDAGRHSQAALTWTLDGNDKDARGGALIGPERGLCTELVYGTLRHARRLDAWITTASDRGLLDLDAATHAALRIGAYQLAGLDKIPEFAALNATVEAAKGRVPNARVGYVNAVLRRLAREAPWLAAPQPALLPPWQVRALTAFVADLGVEADAVVDAHASPAPLHVHVVTPSRAGAVAEFAADGVEVSRVAALPGVYAIGAGAFFDSTAYRRRAAIAQDAASAAITEWVGAAPNLRVADVCAGRGAKSLFLAASGAEVDALDVDDDKLVEAAELVRSAGFALHRTAVADVAMHMPLQAESYDAVLVDAPCSGLGTLRRRPEIGHRRRMTDVLRLSTLQAAILRNAATLVRPGGALVYAVCTFTAEEGAGVVDAFLSDNPAFARDDARPAWLQGWCDGKGDLRSHPLIEGADLFYAARLIRRS